MKVYVIKYPNDTYKGLETRLPTGWRLRSHGLREYKTVSNIDEAIHYTSHKKAAATLNAFVRVLKKNIEENNVIIQSQPKTYSAQYATNCNNSYQAILAAYGTGTIIEHECEKENSNIRAVDGERIKFKLNHRKEPIKGTYKIITEPKTSSHYCKLCGVVLKNIPQVHSYTIYAMRICCKCGIALGEQCKAAWDGIDEERRKYIDNEFFIHNLG